MNPKRQVKPTGLRVWFKHHTPHTGSARGWTECFIAIPPKVKGGKPEVLAHGEAAIGKDDGYGMDAYNARAGRKISVFRAAENLDKLTRRGVLHEYFSMHPKDAATPVRFKIGNRLYT